MSKVYNYIFILLCVSLPYEDLVSAVPNILLLLLVVLSFFVIKTEDVVEVFKKEQAFLGYASIIAIVLLFSFIHIDFSFLKKLLIPFVFILISLPFKNYDKLKKLFIISVFLAVVLSVYNIIEYILSSEDFKFSKGNHINDILVSERLYIGFYSVISMVCSLDFIKSNHRLKRFFIVNVVLLTVFLFFIAARIAIVSSVLILFYFIICELNRKQRFFLGFTAILVITLFFILNKNLTKRFFHLDDIYNDGLFEKIKIHEPRYDIWKCSVEVFFNEKAYLFGNGYTHSNDLLVDCYKNEILIQKRQDWFVEKKFNTHNQFLDFLLAYGVITLILLILLLTSLIYRGNYTFLSNSLLGALILIMFVENIFYRQLGCYLFALVFVIILNIKKRKESSI
ncbi:O-antigen ligase family protein [Mangrovimonas yunxiaonensis]|uniref:O-antigen ligase family protein n=1 Tax=Mangrovimonas yunxiaonensis TaxID=1197477 RepID=UPI0016644448|nr:O-antigen ligase family protein [Mangrovimonas yunxiaonensis]